MPQYRKKPVIIEAIQFFSSDKSTHENVNFGWPTEENSTPHHLEEKYWCGTLEGEHIVSDGDWIITGVKGEHYPCKPDIFEAIYEAV